MVSISCLMTWSFFSCSLPNVETWLFSGQEKHTAQEMRRVLCLETVSVWISKWDCCAYNRSECVDCGSTNTWPLLKWPTNKKGIADFTILCSSCMFLRRVSMGASASAKSCWILICRKCHKKRSLRKSSKFSLSHVHSRSGTSDWKESAEKLVETEC